MGKPDVSGHGDVRAPSGGPRVPQQRSTPTHRPQSRDAAGLSPQPPGDPLGVETRRPHVGVTTWWRPWDHGGLSRPMQGGRVEVERRRPAGVHQGAQQPQDVYPLAPSTRRPPESWDEPLQRDRG